MASDLDKIILKALRKGLSDRDLNSVYSAVREVSCITHPDGVELYTCRDVPFLELHPPRFTSMQDAYTMHFSCKRDYRILVEDGDIPENEKTDAPDKSGSVWNVNWGPEPDERTRVVEARDWQWAAHPISPELPRVKVHGDWRPEHFGAISDDIVYGVDPASPDGDHTALVVHNTATGEMRVVNHELWAQAMADTSAERDATFVRVMGQGQHALYTGILYKGSYYKWEDAKRECQRLRFEMIEARYEELENEE